jgi:hypothetical protein
MKLPYKYLLFILVTAFTVHQGYLIITEFFESRTIEVQKEIYESDEKDYLKGYVITNTPFEQFDIIVTPKSFWDYLLLTNKDGDFLSLILQVASGCCLLWYFVMLDFNNPSWKRGRLLFTAIFLITIAFLAINWGLDHTKVFWKSIYTHHSKTDFWKYDFYVDTKSNAMFYFYALLAVCAIFKEVMWYYGKPKITISNVEPVK